MLDAQNPWLPPKRLVKWRVWSIIWKRFGGISEDVWVHKQDPPTFNPELLIICLAHAWIWLECKSTNQRKSVTSKNLFDKHREFPHPLCIWSKTNVSHMDPEWDCHWANQETKPRHCKWPAEYSKIVWQTSDATAQTEGIPGDIPNNWRICRKLKEKNRYNEEPILYFF